jgi:spermidine/putrescine transport system ATP-binding protein
MKKKPLVNLEAISKQFYGEFVLNHINLSIHHHEFITLLGPSGCGKSTLLRLIAGLDQPSSGRIILNDQDITALPPNERPVNMVFQSYALFPHLTVFENVAFGLRCRRIMDAEKVHRVLRMVKLEAFKDRKPHQLSGGQQQRVAVARAVVNEPKVLLLDEPLSALDYRLRKTMRSELKALQRQLGITFIFVTHDQEEALSMSDRIVVMNPSGHIEQIGTPRHIYEHPANMYVATSIGEVNVFSTTVVNRQDSKIDVDIENKRYTLETKQAFQVGQPLKLVVRPEDLKSWDIHETTESEREMMFPATVEQVVYKGSTVDLVLRTQSGKRLSTTEFFDENDEDLDFRIGETVWVEWPKGWEVIFPDEN